MELSIYGLAYEYVYVKENENDLVTKNLSAENTFMVKDDSIEERELFAVYYYVRKDDSGTSSTFLFFRCFIAASAPSFFSPFSSTSSSASNVP